MHKRSSPLFLIQKKELYFFPQIKEPFFHSLDEFKKQNVIKKIFESKVNSLICIKPQNWFTKLICRLFIHFFYSNQLLKAIKESSLVVFFDYVVRPDIVYYSNIVNNGNVFIYTWNVIDENRLNIWKRLLPSKMIATYSRIEAEKYGLTFVQPLYVRTPIKECTDIIFDIVFIGRVKESRFGILLDLFDQLEKCGLNNYLGILVSGNDNIDRIERPYLHYLDSFIDYSDYLSVISKTKCLVDIVYQDNLNPTFRTVESLFYSKKLITNNPAIAIEPYYNENNTLIIDLNNLDCEEIKSFLLKKHIVRYSGNLKSFSLESFVSKFTKI